MAKKISNLKIRKILNHAYKNSPAAYSTLKKLYNYSKKEIPNLNRGIVGNYLLSQRIYSQYKQKPNKSKMITRPVIKKDCFEMIACDLLTLISLKTKNKYFQYIMVIFKPVSHYMIGIPLK